MQTGTPPCHDPQPSGPRGRPHSRSQDRVEDFHSFSLGSGDATTHLTALACADKTVRVLRRDDEAQRDAGRAESISVGMPVSAIQSYVADAQAVREKGHAADGGGAAAGDNDGGTLSSEAASAAIDVFLTTSEASRQLLYGTEGGTIGQLMVGSRTTERGWTLPSAAGVPIDMCTGYDLTADGVPDIVVGRDNGAVEVYGFELGAEPTLMLQKSVGEGVTAVDAGTCTASSSMDAVISTYSGKIIAFAPVGAADDSAADIEDTVANTHNAARRLSLFRKSSRLADGASGGGADGGSAPEADAASTSVAASRRALVGGGGKGMNGSSKRVAAGDATVSASEGASASARVQSLSLQSEIATLKKRVADKEAIYAQRGGKALVGLGVGQFQVNDRMTMNDDATCTLVIETPMPMAAVALKADVDVTLVEDKTQQVRAARASGVAVLSIHAPLLTVAHVHVRAQAIVSCTPCDAGSPNHLLATFRMQDSQSRLHLRLRVAEGKGGTISAHVIPRRPPMNGDICVYKIKPLCLHRRAQHLETGLGDAGEGDGGDGDSPPLLSTAPLNTMVVTGSFSMARVHAWVTEVVPEVPERVPATETEKELVFVHGMLGTHLVVRYGAGRASFASESASAIALARECVTSAATRAGELVDIRFKLDPASIGACLELVEPRLAQQAALATRVNMLEALRELTLGEDSIAYLDADHKDTLAAAEELQAHHANAGHVLRFLKDIVRRLNADWNVLRGTNPKHRASEVDRALERLDFGELRAAMLR